MWVSTLNGMRGITPNPAKMEDPLLQELLQIADTEAPGELGSSDYEKRCGPLMTSDDVQSAAPLNTKRKNNWAANTWKAWAISCNAASSAK